MKMAADGTLYVGGPGGIFRVSPSGAQSFVAGTGVIGYSGDGGPAVSAQVGNVFGLALDAAGNIYFTEVFAGNRVREVTTDGKIRTIAGTASTGFNGDNQPATSTSLSEPSGIAVDGSGNIYVADTNNYRIRKFTVGGAITTVAGTGNYGQPVNGSATRSPIGWPGGLWLDTGGNLFATDSGNMVVLKISTGGTLSRVAGNLNEFGAPGDGLATNVSLDTPVNVSVDRNGSLLIVDQSHLVRKVTLDGALTTVAGRIHYGGDGGPAVSALLNEPNEIALDANGNAFIADGGNYRIRKVTPGGSISTWGGNGIPDFPPNGSAVAGASLPYIYAMASDLAGNLYLGTESQVLKVTFDGKVFVIAGTGDSGSSGDGGPATAATLVLASGIALDSAGNVYVADTGANRVRVIEAATGRIRAFAGTGARGFSGDGGLATGAQIDIYATSIVRQTPLAVDQLGNVFIGDVNNNRVRMVSPQGLISTVLGNGRFGIPADGSVAVSAPYSDAESMAVDTAGNLYIASHSTFGIDVLSGGKVRRIAGAFRDIPVDDTALSNVFRVNGMKVDANGDIYAADGGNNIIRKLILNSPKSLDISDGNNYRPRRPARRWPSSSRCNLTGGPGWV